METRGYALAKITMTHFDRSNLAVIIEKLIENKNWVTVRDKCPQINVQFKWDTFF